MRETCPNNFRERHFISIKMFPFFLVLLSLTTVYSCREESPENSPKKILQVDESDKLTFFDKDEFVQKPGAKEVIKNELLKDFDKPLSSYPLIEASTASYKKNGILYRDDIQSPFTGRLIEKNSDGVVVLEASFLNGQPHGQQIRRNDDGTIAMEAFFEYGILSGIKTKWWPNGLIKEEEYWQNGNYKGRCIWDDHGRLVKKERVK